MDLSRKFCSAEKFVPGPFFRKNIIVPPGTDFPEKRAGAENFAPVYVLLKIDCKELYDARMNCLQNTAPSLKRLY